MKHRTLGKTRSSIEKALDILLAFTPRNEPMGTVELGLKLSLHPATVNRILQILDSKGFLQQDDRTRKFSLGPSAFQLGRTIFQSVSNDLMRVAPPYLENLCQIVGETVALEVMSGKSLVIAFVERGTRGLVVAPKVGDIVPNHAAAGAKAILAHLDPKVADTFLGEKMQSLTHKTITNKQVLRRELRKAKQEGVAFCREEMEIGFNAIGVPVFNHDEKPIAAVAVAGPTHRVTCDIRSPIVAALKNAASNISVRLFYSGSTDQELSSQRQDKTAHFANRRKRPEARVTKKNGAERSHH